MTTQEAYEKIREHFSKPGAQRAYESKATSDLSGCVYRGLDENGNRDPHSPIRCAFGVLIPDDRYDPEMERKYCGEVIRSYLDDLFPGDQHGSQAKFLSAAQGEHDDTSKDFETFIERLDTLAREYHLTVPNSNS